MLSSTNDHGRRMRFDQMFKFVSASNGGHSPFLDLIGRQLAHEIDLVAGLRAEDFHGGRAFG